ncbi:hypothetical protein NHX12_008707 [Muraenolepis orangiensis]|uniref:Uncharacterized protein n=1 Tax=Muraenolepis orangiensis TaxID=630683 RepID=A0A9Q0IAF9_9TELE|nr:hypothetical protein NHX12_008707 [Muraenolepis orangiensis]
MVNFIIEMLSNRSFSLQTSDGQQSRLRRLRNGVLQGSVYIYNLPETTSRKYGYAEDLAIRKRQPTWKVIEEGLKQNMGILDAYLCRWHLQLSPGKTVSVAYHLNSEATNWMCPGAPGVSASPKVQPGKYPPGHYESPSKPWSSPQPNTVPQPRSPHVKKVDAANALRTITPGSYLPVSFSPSTPVGYLKEFRSGAWSPQSLNPPPCGTPHLSVGQSLNPPPCGTPHLSVGQSLNPPPCGTPHLSVGQSLNPPPCGTPHLSVGQSLNPPPCGTPHLSVGQSLNPPPCGTPHLSVGQSLNPPPCGTPHLSVGQSLNPPPCGTPHLSVGQSLNPMFWGQGGGL